MPTLRDESDVMSFDSMEKISVKQILCFEAKQINILGIKDLKN